MQSTPRNVQFGLLKASVAEVGATRTVVLAGELDLSNARELQGMIEALAGDGAEAIVLDLEALDFIDSTGMALLVSADRRLNNGRAYLRLVPSKAAEVRRVLALTGLDRALPFLPDGK